MAQKARHMVLQRDIFAKDRLWRSGVFARFAFSIGLSPLCLSLCVITLFSLMSLFPASAQISLEDFDDEAWRYRELERLLYIEDADARLQAALSELSMRYEVAERNFRLSGDERIEEYGCPAASTLGQLDPHVDPNVTIARLYRDYGRYFLCIRQYDDAIAAFSSAVPLYRAGFGREALIERTDLAYLQEVRSFYDQAIAETMKLMEAAGAWQSYAVAQALTEEYWPQRLITSDEVLILRGDVIDAWEEASQMLALVGMDLEADDARQTLRAVLTFDQSNGLDIREAR